MFIYKRRRVGGIRPKNFQPLAADAEQEGREPAEAALGEVGYSVDSGTGALHQGGLGRGASTMVPGLDLTPSDSTICLSPTCHPPQEVYKSQIDMIRPVVMWMDPIGLFRNKFLSEMFDLPYLV